MPDGLTYYLHDESAAFRVRLVGDLCKESTADVELACHTAFSVLRGRPWIVDLTSLESIDETGEALLDKWQELGAQLVVTTREARARLHEMTGVEHHLEEHSKRPKWLPARAASWLLTMGAAR
jgi:anti-anti-sigma regulatory factor